MADLPSSIATTPHILVSSANLSKAPFECIFDTINNVNELSSLQERAVSLC